MKFRPMLRTSFNVRMTCGRRRLRSSAAWHSWLMQKIDAYEAHLYSLEVQRQVEQALMERRYITSLESVPPILRQ
jgi:hypothetical protein